MKKALFFTAFNRVGYLKETLASWAKVENFDGWHIGFYIEPSDVIDQIGQVIKSFLDDINFDSYSIHYNQELLGNATNTWQGFEDLFNDYDFVVLAEDDVIVSKDVLRYFDETEKMYRNDYEAAVISANTKWDTSDPTLVVREQGFNGLVWGTWKKYWTSYFSKDWDKDYSSDPVHNGWDWHLNLRLMPNNNLKNINPLASRSNHIGINGIHCDDSIFDQTQSPAFKDDYTWEFITEKHS